MSRYLRRLKMDTCEVMLHYGPLMDFVGSSEFLGRMQYFEYLSNIKQNLSL